ncbi:methylaspartate mutase epsilon subunit [Amycolatopsis pretoriensis]|uniref:Methylaspartate mutase epsilon subunit n=1 Tax=Amycolatopsis pretoriensis TaxID=218821 RepID=A0A1H5QHH1_9PSEU|nr:methylaspartate mutase [Amycolatopsis pretoriensis]SEF24637.1 methylaspartate mutase epsilon subunit [Amycolatopsis pretoriensis]
MNEQAGREPAGRAGSEDNFGSFVQKAQALGQLVVQPRMGFSDPSAMRAGLIATRHAAATTVGTITLDSYTRTNQHAAARAALADGTPLNGYPITTFAADMTRRILDGVQDADFPIQVRHGSAAPQRVFAALVRTGLAASEGGPVSYCLPYGPIPLQESVRNWEESCALISGLRTVGIEPHLESFGGCMMGQLCPPSLLVALSVLEALFFRQHGVHSVSLSYAQQTHPEQDEEAVAALRRLARELLGSAGWHVVIYEYMGVYPKTPAGSMLLGEAAARLAIRTGAARLVVKTAAEAVRLPTINENVEALERASAAADGERRQNLPLTTQVSADSQTYAEAKSLVTATLRLSEDIGQALVQAFAQGLLDVPFCLHADNAGRARSYIASSGRLSWSDIGAMPLRGVADVNDDGELTSAGLLDALNYVSRSFDERAVEHPVQRRVARAGTDPLFTVDLSSE